ncbi:MAG: SHOCT domain-containing protein [Bacteroidota bacterium]|nr:SHOCT domain-containing protein [Bacteroidota bacterium]
MELFLGWLIFSLVVGSIGSGRKIGFWGAFLLSLILSPLIGLIFALTSKSNNDESYRQQSLQAQRNQEMILKRMEKEKSVSSSKSVADELEKLRKLRDEHSISEEEFQKLKDKVINS